VRVLTLEDVYAIKITDYDAISAAGIDRAEVAAILFDTYLKQIFEDYFFHADPHPGNLFVSPVAATSKRKVTWKLTFVDFGMAGIVPEHLRLGMRDMVIGIATRDARKLVASYQTLGVLLPGADVELLEKAEAQLFDRFWGMSMSELRKMPRDDMRRFAHQFRDLMFAMPFQVPQNLLLLGRSLAILSGMCTGLDPEFNVWKHLAPYAKTLVAAEGQSTWDVLLDQLGDLAKELLALPAQTGRILTRMERGELNVNAPHVSRQMYHLETAVNRLLGGVLVAAFLFAGALLYHGGDRSLSYVFWGGSGLSLLWTVFLARGHPPPNT
jgi:predicted unusual protein kinase regulating ubiquinone biosynthesis (AarF/ABC1/UbiB family)